MSLLERLSFATDVEPAQGVIRAHIRDWLACAESVRVDGQNLMTLRLHRENPALRTLETLTGELNAEPDLVLRALYGDGVVQERRIAEVTETDEGGDLYVDVTAHGMLHELSYRGHAFAAQSDGGRTYHFQRSNLTAEAHIRNYILPGIWKAGATYWDIGEIEVDEPVTVVYDKDSALSALRKVANAHLSYLELEATFDAPALKYRINLRRQIGAGSPPIRIRGGLNLRGLGVTRSNRNVVNRMYGFGGTDPDAGRGTMANNVWQMAVPVRFISPTERYLRMIDPAGGPGPIAFDGQYTDTGEGRYRLLALAPGAESYYIVESDATTGEFRVDTAIPGFLHQAGWFRLAGPTEDLAYVERRPPSVGGRVPIVREGYIERPEVQPIENLLRNPFGRTKTPGGNPTDWGLSAGGPFTVEQNPVYYRTGDSSIRKTFSVSSGNVTISGRNQEIRAGRLSYYADILVLEGRVQVSMDVNLVTGLEGPGGKGPSGNPIRYPEDWPLMWPGKEEPVPASLGVGQWERVGIEAAHDCLTWPTLFARLRIIPLVIPSVVVIDAGQISNTSTHRELVEGSGGTVLLQAANAELLAMSDLEEEISVQTLDLATVDDSTFPFRNYVQGAGLEVLAPKMGKIIRTRVLGWDRDHKEPEKLVLHVATGRGSLARVLATPSPTLPPPTTVTGR